MPLTFVKSQKGKKLLLFNGYLLFTKHTYIKNTMKNMCGVARGV